MIFISKKKFEQKVQEEVDRRVASEKHILLFEVEIGDETKDQVETHLDNITSKLKEKLGHSNFVVVPTSNGRGHINITYVA